jgi:excinuclease UvrABC nuclease subunit
MIEKIKIPEIILKWSEWVNGDDLEKKYNEGVKVPGKPGVYEAKYGDSDERLTIGKASDLRHRIKQGLVRGKTQHDAGYQIRNHENTSKIKVRWAETARPSCVEEHLHQEHVNKFGKLPKYTKST